MKSLALIAVAVVSFGALALSGCSACSPQTDTASKKPVAPAVTCGPGTVPQGNTCVGASR